MHRLLVETETLLADAPQLPAGAAHHLKVVRPRKGEAVTLFDGRGGTRLFAWDGQALKAAGDVRRHPPAPVRLTLMACVTKGSRWDWTIEKAVELGASRIVPVISARCVVRLAAAERAAKAERWRRIAEDAARQSDAVYLPEVLAAVDFPEALRLARETSRVFAGILADPPPPPMWRAVAEAAASGTVRDWAVCVGPEGDFTPEERTALLDVATPVSMGPTVLRAETAAVFGLSVLAAAACAASSTCEKEWLL